VFCNDIENRGYSLDQISDFTTAVFPKQFDAIITDPPQGGRTSILFKGFIETGDVPLFVELEKRSLPWFTLSGVGLASKNAM